MENMAYGQWKRKPKRNYRRKPKVSSGVKAYVKKAVNKAEETKYLDILPNITASSTVFGYQHLTAITQGTGYQNRIGDKVRLIGIRYLLQLVPGDNENVTRMLTFCYKPGGSNPQTTPAIGNLVGPVDVRSGFMPYRDVLTETRFAPVDGSTSATVSINKYYKGYIKVNKVLNYAGTNFPVTNSLWYQLHSDSAVVPNPGITGYFRVYFKDA